MKIFVKAKPGAKTEKVEKIDDSHKIISGNFSKNKIIEIKDNYMLQ